MHTRTEPLKCPDRAPYIRVTLDIGEHVLRVPSLATAADAGQAFGFDVMLQFFSEAKQSKSVQELAAKAIGLGPDFLGAMGYLIGQAWRHETRALDATLGADAKAYGRAVHEELHDEAYTLGDQLALFGAIIGEIGKGLAMQEEAQDRAVFTQRPQAATTSPSSISKSSGFDPTPDADSPT